MTATGASRPAPTVGFPAFSARTNWAGRQLGVDLKR